ncbi:MAG: PIN domain-containing protein [Candidatus Desulfofervidus auxilii]|nr:PIN domain-containing protein [Candidatus Desulfofervidus auxilii]
MKLLLDTTYFLPVIGISVKNILWNTIIELIKGGYQVLISEITFFELSAKGAKYIVAGTLTPERVSKGMRALLYDDRIEKIPIYDTSILLTAFKLRMILNDFIDCLILSSAINRAEVLVTEDKDILEISNKRSFQNIIQISNPKFKIKKLKNII